MLRLTPAMLGLTSSARLEYRERTLAVFEADTSLCVT